MNREETLRLLDDLFEFPAGTLKGPELLEEMGVWNSMAMMSFIALADEHFGKFLSPRQFINCASVEDLLRLVIGNG